MHLGNILCSNRQPRENHRTSFVVFQTAAVGAAVVFAVGAHCARASMAAEPARSGSTLIVCIPVAVWTDCGCGSLASCDSWMCNGWVWWWCLAC